MYSSGDWFMLDGVIRTFCLLAQVGVDTVAMIVFESRMANRRTEPVRVGDPQNITEDEFRLIAGNPSKYAKVHNVKITALAKVQTFEPVNGELT